MSLIARAKQFSRDVWESVFRHGLPRRARARSQVMVSNFFLHIQGAHTHKHTLRPGYTLGLGLITFFLFLILCVTGVILMVFYVPSVESAYDRIKDLNFVVTGGRIVRNLHRWAAHGMVICAFAHMARVFYTGSYKKPREFNWCLGLSLLVLTLALSFTGYLLPWDQLAFWAITIGSNIAGSFREVTGVLGITEWFDLGGLIRRLLIGGETIGQDALIRFYVLHVVVLPAVMIAVLAVHFWRIRKDGGLSRPVEAGGSPDNLAADALEAPGRVEPKTYGLMLIARGTSPAADKPPEGFIKSWPRLLIVELAVFMLTMAVAIVLAVLFDAPLKEIANPSLPENPAKAPWYFLGLQELVSYSGFVGGVAIPSVVMLGLALIPYVDRDPRGVGIWCGGPPETNGRRVAFGSALFATVYVVGLITFTVNWGWLRDWLPRTPQWAIMLVNPGTLIVLVFALVSAWIGRRARSARLAAIALFTMFLVGFVILTCVGTFFRGPNWDFYWTEGQWPAPH